MRALYTLLLYLLTPVVLLRLLWRGLSLHDYWHRWNERFGFVRAPASPIVVWVHAVSVGEALAALPLIHSLLAQHGEGRIWVTTTTPTGSARVVSALGSRVHHSYAPYDLPGAVSRFLRRLRPEQVVVMETELWPNLFAQLAARKTPLVIANARLSMRSLEGYSRVPGFAARTLACTRWVAAQSEADAKRFISLGAPRVRVMGNIKFDVELPRQQLDLGKALRAGLGNERPVWIAASTHEGEEAAALAAHASILRALPDALLLLVPRHPQRFDAVAGLVQRKGLSLMRRSLLEPELHEPHPHTQVLLGDSMGEMFLYYAASDVAFVGGSFVPIGGHNVLEPAAVGLPVLFGPQMQNFQAARDLLLDCGGAVELQASDALASVVLALLRDPRRRRQLGREALDAVAENRGALQRLLELLSQP